MDDDSGWDQVLVQGWGPLVRAAVVDRIERALIGRRGLLVRTMADPDAARYAWTEALHRLVLDAIRAETGADLDSLGSQAAWACYDDTWRALEARWRDGEPLVVVPPAEESIVVTLLRDLPPVVAEAAGADVACDPYEPLRVAGHVLVDVEGLFACIAHDDRDVLSDLDRARMDQIIARVRAT